MLIAINRIIRGAEGSAWLQVPHWQRARIRVEEGLGTDLVVRVRGRRGETARLGEPLSTVLDELKPMESELEVDLDGIGAIQVVADIQSGDRREVRVVVEEVRGA